VVARLRKNHSGEPHVVYDNCRSHKALPRKNALLLTLLEHISVAATRARDADNLPKTPDGQPLIESPGAELLRRDSGSGLKKSLVEGTDVNVFIPVLTEIANLTDGGYAIVANTARGILIEQTIPTVEQRRQRLKASLQMALAAGSTEEREARMNTFLEENASFRDLLVYFLLKDKTMQQAVLELYIRKYASILPSHGHIDAQTPKCLSLSLAMPFPPFPACLTPLPLPLLPTQDLQDAPDQEPRDGPRARGRRRGHMGAVDLPIRAHRGAPRRRVQRLVLPGPDAACARPLEQPAAGRGRVGLGWGGAQLR
jgi:hypothetical protein